MGTALAAAAAGQAGAQAARGPVKVASIYTVPIEQQWVSRLHAALKTAEGRGDTTYKWSENVANNDYERVLRGYAEEGAELIVGEIFGVERAVRRVAATYPKVAMLMGSSFGPSKPNLAVFDNFIQEPSYLTGMIAGRATKAGTIGMVGGFAIPEVNRLMQAFMEGARATNPGVKFLVGFIGSWYDPPKAKEAAFAMMDRGADVLYAERFGVTDAEGARAEGDRQRRGHLRPVFRHRARQRPVAHGTHDGPGHQGRARGPVGGRGLRPVQPDAVWRRIAQAGRGAGACGRGEAGARQGAGDQRRPVPRQRQRRGAEVVLTAPAAALSPGALSPGALAPVILAIEGVTKHFGAFTANDGVSLDLRRGEALALLGENGAGKTTLINILFGHYVADAGTVQVADAAGALRPLPPGRPAAALAAGVGMVQQHFALAGSLTVLENVVLGTRGLLSPWLGLRAARARLAALMARSGLHVPPDRRVSALGVGERQRVEILKVLYRGARILVLDEPTAVLTPAEAAQLFQTLRRLQADGLSVVFISHKLGEVAAFADRVAVLRAGRKVADQPVGALDKASLARLMVGRDLPAPGRTPSRPGAPALVLDRVTVPGAGARPGLKDVSLQVHAGEVVGIAGVSGNGQAALAAAISGTQAPARGTVRVGGRVVHTAAGSIRAGVGRIPEDLHHEGIVPNLSVAENLVLETLGAPAVQRCGFLRRGAMRAAALRALAAHDIRCPGPDTPVRLLSGGNIQKAILARVLDAGPGVVLANQPTRGLDAGAAGAVHRRLLDARDRGAAVLVVSDDLDELFALADRIGVMSGGRLSAPQPASSLTPERLGLLMAGEAST